MNAFIDGNDQFIGLIYRKFSLRVYYCMNTGLYKFAFKKVQILEVTLFVDEIMFQRSNRTFHIKRSRLLAVQSCSAYCHEVAHYSLGCHDTQFFVSLQLALQNNRQHFLSSLNELEILLIGKIKRSNFIVKYSNILVHVSFRLFDVFCYI